MKIIEFGPFSVRCYMKLTRAVGVSDRPRINGTAVMACQCLKRRQVSGQRLKQNTRQPAFKQRAGNGTLFSAHVNERFRTKTGGEQAHQFDLGGLT